MSSRFKDLLSQTSSGTNRPLNGPKKELPTFCVFCKNNGIIWNLFWNFQDFWRKIWIVLGEDPKVYKSHILKTKDGKVLCPVRNFFYSNFRKVISTLDFYSRCCSITLVRNAGIPVTMRTPYATVLTPKVSISISKLQYSVWKSQKKSHSTLRA